MEERNFFKQRLTAEEVKAFAERAGGVFELVAPTRRSEVEGMTAAQTTKYLVEDPARLRRPIIDTGDALYVGFNKAVQESLDKVK